MSVPALAWVLDFSETGANDRLVMLTLGHHADNDGYVALARHTIARETRLSDITVKRILDRLAHTCELREVLDGQHGPDWWRAIPPNRRPRLFQLVRFAATRPGHRMNPQHGGAEGARPGRAGVQATDPDLGERDANVDKRSMNNQSLGVSVENEPVLVGAPWITDGITRAEWLANR